MMTNSTLRKSVRIISLLVLVLGAIGITAFFCADSRLDDALIIAARDGDEAFVEKLLRVGANPNACGSWEGCDTAIYKALTQDGSINEELVKMLVEHGADVNKPNHLNLYFAAYYGRLELMKYLMAKGASLPDHKRAIATLKDRLLTEINRPDIYNILFKD
jgi:ankyrin repeat protein